LGVLVAEYAATAPKASSPDAASVAVAPEDALVPAAASPAAADLSTAAALFTPLTSQNRAEATTEPLKVIVIVPALTAAGLALVVAQTSMDSWAAALALTTFAQVLLAESVTELTVRVIEFLPTATCRKFPAVVVTPEKTRVVAAAVSVFAAV
jgi:hypothetical protein